MNAFIALMVPVLAMICIFWLFLAIADGIADGFEWLNRRD